MKRGERSVARIFEENSQSCETALWVGKN